MRRNGRIALSLTIEGTTHVCAAKSVKGVLKADFEPVEKAIQGLKERMDQEDRLEREAQRSKRQRSMLLQGLPRQRS